MNSAVGRIAAPENDTCAVRSCGRPRAGAARSSRALGLVHCGLDGHRDRVRAHLVLALAAEGTYLLADLGRDEPALFGRLVALTAGRPPIRVDLDRRPPKAFRRDEREKNVWAFLDVGRHAGNRDIGAGPDANPFLEFPKIVYRPVRDRRSQMGWQLLASPLKKDWYTYCPLDWCLGADAGGEERAGATREIIGLLDDMHRKRLRALDLSSS